MNYKIFFLILIVSNSAIAEELSLGDFLKRVKEQNLNLKQEEAKLSSAEAVASLGIRLPPPMLEFNQRKEDGGVTTNGFEVTQEIPFPTKLSSDYSARRYAALAQKEMFQANYNETLAKAKLAYIEFWIAQEQVNLLNDKKSILVQHLKLSRSAVRSDSFLSIHLLKAESDMDFLENEIESMRQILREKQIVLAEILNEEVDSFRPTATEPELSPIPPKVESHLSPQVEALRLTAEGFKAQEAVAKSSWLPDFSLKYEEMEMANLSARRYKEITFGVTLPFLYFWEPHSEVKRAKADSLQADFNLNRNNKNIESKIAQLYSKAESILKQISNLKNKLVPRAGKRMKIVHNLAPRDMETLADHRETMETFPNLKMSELELRKKYEEAVAELGQYISNKGENHE